MAFGEAGERTETATPRRRSEARKRGQVARSSELSQVLVLLGVLMTLGAAAHTMSRVVTGYFQHVFTHLPGAQLTTNDVLQQGAQAFWTLLKAVAPLAATALVIGIVANIAQTGPLWAIDSLKPDFNRLNPLTGAQRFVSSRSLVELVKSLYKIGIIGFVAYTTIQSGYPQLMTMTRMEVAQGVALIGDLVNRMALRIAVTMLVLAALDYAYQRWQHEKQLRMTKEEVRQEYKQSEGDPKLKARIRARQREIAKKRMMAEVPNADVIVTNPTHVAVALRYDPEQMGAPLVVAKGQDLLAQKIKELARENDVPIVENPPLARALYKQVDLGREVPAELYEAVAEVLAFVYQINERRRARAGFATF
jgi:flagellar biosynthetic protein FlhB